MNFDEVLKTRNNALYFGITEYQDNFNSWVGGNAPTYFDEKDYFNGEKYYFYLTLQNPLNKNKQYSIFTPDFDTALEYNSYPDCKVLLIEHDLCKQSKNSTYKHPETNYPLAICELGEDKDGPEKSNVIKFGGEAIPIQWGLNNKSIVEKDGYNFLFQINEIGMGDVAVFMSGCIYVYGKILNNNVLNPFVAYWEYS